MSLGKALIYYINPSLDLTFFIVASCSYFYITKEVSRHRKTKKRTEKQLQQNNTVVHDKHSKNRFQLLVPTLIILTFYYLWVSQISLDYSSSEDIYHNLHML